MRLSTVHTRRSTFAAQRPGFTLLELLVVIGIIAILATLIGVVASRARGGASKFQLAAQLQAIAVALDAYKTEFASYPITRFDDTTVTYDDDANVDGYRGARLLCKALMGSSGGQSGTIAAVGGTYDLARGNQDGKAGLGFAVPGRSGVATVDDAAGNMKGKTYGPFLATNKFRIVNITAVPVTVNSVNYVRGDQIAGNDLDDRAVLLDANGSPILYYPCLNPQAPIFKPAGGGTPPRCAYVSLGRLDTTAAGASESIPAPYYPGTSMYVSTDNGAFLTAPMFRLLLGDAGDSSGAGKQDGYIDQAINEKPAVQGKYILWTAGPDGIFGRNTDPNAGAKQRAELDDVTNFDLE